MGWRIRIRETEGCDDPQPFLSPDLVLSNSWGASIHFDHALADADETMNRQGLRSKEALHTAIIIQLFTDRRIRADQVHPDTRSPDPMGWWGDSVDVRDDIGETEMGSHLWTLRRSILNEETVALAADYCHEALLPIVEQGAVASFSIETEALGYNQQTSVSGILGIGIEGYSFDNNRIYEQHFEALWTQIRELSE